MCRGPTCYAGLIPPSQAGRPTARRLKTFQDVAAAAQRSQAAAPLMQLAQSDWMPPVVAPTAMHSAAAQAPANEGPLPPPSPTQPMDWSVKASVRFTSAQPFVVWEEARTAPRREGETYHHLSTFGVFQVSVHGAYNSTKRALLASPCRAVIQAQRDFASCSGGGALSLQQRLIAAAMTWQFPHDPQPAVTGAAARARADALRPRRLHWQTALASLYDSLRCGRCDAFYVTSPDMPASVGRKPFTVMFRAAGVGGHRRLHAVITRSTPGLRALLDQMAVGYEAPLLPGGAGSAGRDARMRPSSSASAEGTRSMLVFEGALRVHGVLELLLSRAFELHGDGCDVPLLLAPTQFEHASLVACQVEAPGKALVLRGPHVPPWVADRVLSVLSETQAGVLTMACEPCCEAQALNWAPRNKKRKADAEAEAEAEAPALDDFEAQQRGCLGAGEAARWRRATPCLSGAAVKELTVTGGCFAITKLTSRVL